MQGTYNALDNQETARKLLEQLKLEKADIRASIDYNEATGGEYWTWDDSERLEISINIMAHLIAALNNYLDGTKGQENDQPTL